MTEYDNLLFMDRSPADVGAEKADPEAVENRDKQVLIEQIELTPGKTYDLITSRMIILKGLTFKERFEDGSSYYWDVFENGRGATIWAAPDEDNSVIER